MQQQQVCKKAATTTSLAKANKVQKEKRVARMQESTHTSTNTGSLCVYVLVRERGLDLEDKKQKQKE